MVSSDEYTQGFSHIRLITLKSELNVTSFLQSNLGLQSPVGYHSG